MWTHPAWPWRSGDRLRAYAEHCNAVEGNTTFYATPSRDTVASWARQTGPDFRMVLKLPRAVTHEQRLRDSAATLDFLRTIEPLGPRVHALWIQLPASFGPPDVPALDDFLRGLPAQHRYAVEVRHPRFFERPEELGAVLAGHGAEWIPFDTTALFSRPPTSDAERDAWAKKPRNPLRTEALTEFPIVRYIGRDDPAETVKGWQRWIAVTKAWLREGRSPTVFVHTPDNADAPRLAREFHAAVRREVPDLPPPPDPEPLTLF
ncbi:DUF72 domain-containing protein [Dactylosporangium sp. NPDC051485]|uniref:DUF72 domain-containing protein n=1 Tax=Dactylosporangium sp. NPDC051485 TaxID=3154846 RepID=UPI003446CED2